MENGPDNLLSVDIIALLLIHKNSGTVWPSRPLIHLLSSRGYLFGHFQLYRSLYRSLLAVWDASHRSLYEADLRVFFIVSPRHFCPNIPRKLRPILTIHLFFLRGEGLAGTQHQPRSPRITLNFHYFLFPLRLLFVPCLFFFIIYWVYICEYNIQWKYRGN